MNHQQTCIITGCNFILEGSSFGARGDLYISGNQLIFIGSVDRETNALIFTTLADRKDRAVMMRLGVNYLCRRGVIIFPADSTLLNRAAHDHIGPERMQRYFGVPALGVKGA